MDIYNELGKNLPYHPSKQADGDKAPATIATEGKKAARSKDISSTRKQQKSIISDR